ncbi:hypothetical protein B0H11DRAFT_1984505 [Mycena galericulata]|nr:hypothetical protein B0H11DRAFT_1984505 [Mycena galericulata]
MKPATLPLQLLTLTLFSAAAFVAAAPAPPTIAPGGTVINYFALSKGRGGARGGRGQTRRQWTEPDAEKGDDFEVEPAGLKLKWEQSTEDEESVFVAQQPVPELELPSTDEA